MNQNDKILHDLEEQHGFQDISKLMNKQFQPELVQQYLNQQAQQNPNLAALLFQQQQLQAQQKQQQIQNLLNNQYLQQAQQQLGFPIGLNTANIQANNPHALQFAAAASNNPMIGQTDQSTQLMMFLQQQQALQNQHNLSQQQQNQFQNALALNNQLNKNLIPQQMFQQNGTTNSGFSFDRNTIADLQQQQIAEQLKQQQLLFQKMQQQQNPQLQSPDLKDNQNPYLQETQQFLQSQLQQQQQKQQQQRVQNNLTPQQKQQLQQQIQQLSAQGIPKNVIKKHLESQNIILDDDLIEEDQSYSINQGSDNKQKSRNQKNQSQNQPKENQIIDLEDNQNIQMQDNNANYQTLQSQSLQNQNIHPLLSNVSNYLKQNEDKYSQETKNKILATINSNLNALNQQKGIQELNEQQLKELFNTISSKVIDQFKDDKIDRNMKKQHQQDETNSVSVSPTKRKKKVKENKQQNEQSEIQIIDDEEEPNKVQQQQSQFTDKDKNLKIQNQQTILKKNEDTQGSSINNKVQLQNNKHKLNESEKEYQNNKDEKQNGDNKIIQDNNKIEDEDENQDEVEKIKQQLKVQKLSGSRKKEKGNKDNNDDIESNEEENDKGSKTDKKGNKKNNLNSSSNQPDPKVCNNNFCLKNPQSLSKANSKCQPGKQYWLCEQCFESFNKGNHCDYCEQVYENNESVADVKEWVGCESCSKWNHVDCEAEYKNDVKIKKVYKSKDFKYYCMKCEKKSKKQNNSTLLLVNGNLVGTSGNLDASSNNTANQANATQAKKSRNRYQNQQIGSLSQWDESNLDIFDKRKVSPTKRRLVGNGNVSTSQLPSDNEKMSTQTGDLRSKNQDQYGEYYYDISQPYKKRKEHKVIPKDQSLSDILPTRKKYQQSFYHYNFNYFQYFINELAFGVKLILSDDFIKNDLDKFRCCVDEEFKEKYEEEQRIRELNRIKKEEAEQERIKLIQQRKLLQQQKMKERQQNNEDGDDDGDQDSDNKNNDNDDDGDGEENDSVDDLTTNTQLNTRREKNYVPRTTTRRAAAQALVDSEKSLLDDYKDDESNPIHNSNSKNRNRRNVGDKKSRFNAKDKSKNIVSDNEEAKEEDNKSEYTNDLDSNGENSRKSRKKATANKRSMFHQQPSTFNIDDDNGKVDTQMDIENEQDENDDDDENNINNNDDSNSEDQNEDGSDKKNTRYSSRNTNNSRSTRSRSNNNTSNANNISSFSSSKNKNRLTPENKQLKNSTGASNGSTQQNSSAITTTRSGRATGNANKY